MAERTLEVWCFEARAGVLSDEPSGLAFIYAESWRAGGRPRLSHSMPLDGSYRTAAVGAFFGGMLPEGDPRDRGALNYGLCVGIGYALRAVRDWAIGDARC